jgi:eukaryotic-like serine/threonine-protein kinase
MPESTDLKRIGRYDIERVLGEGAMGVVYEGNDTRLHRKVAIKTILKSALDSDSAKEYSKRFAREAQAVARLNHPNIVQVFDFAEEGDVAYIVMEFVKGRELKSFFEAKERFELKEVVHIMGELCEALHFAHEAGIIHRDIKPANVMIDAQGRVKLTDFGVARITDLERTVSERTQAGAIIGTPAYMSPEQIQAGTIDRRTDIFSAGVILYEFLTGAKPFAGTGAWTIAKKIISEEPPVPSSINQTLSPLFDAVIARALSKDVAARYQTAREFGYALKRAQEGLPPVDEVEKTVILSQAAAALAMPAPHQAAGEPTVVRTIPAAAPPAPRTKATELEFWRSIKDGNDPADFDLYVQQFPSGIYAALAKRKSAKLRGIAPEAQEQERREIEEAAHREAEARKKLAEEKAELEASLARREAEFQQREAEAQAKLAEEKARHEAELAQREADFRKREAAGPKKMSLVPVLVAAVVAAIGAGIWQAVKPPDPMAERVAELTRLLEASKQREAELAQSRQREAELLKELDQARRREAEAQKSGDVVKQRELAELTRQREAAAQKQAELTRQREAEAKKQAEAAEERRAEIARLQAESGRKAEPAKKVEPPKPVEAAKPAEPARPVEPAKAAEAPRQVETRPAESKAAEPARLASAAPSPPPEAAATSAESMLQRAIALEGEGRNAEAARLLRRAARTGSGEATGQAAKRLADLLQRGAPGVSRDYAEALRYYEIARNNGVEVAVSKGR